jgi:hypothetical protein
LLTTLARLLVLLSRLLLTRLTAALLPALTGLLRLLATLTAALIVLIHANPPLGCTSPTGRRSGRSKVSSSEEDSLPQFS